ncbi:MAG TPA: arginine repressor [Thermoanaerobaculia bacterium]|nr:arginine repressor [Thermoanaerobaculia bacterium]
MPTDTHLRDQRQREILAILQEHPVANQIVLMEELSRRGIQATQSSVSRDLRDMGIPRVAGRYVPPASGPANGDGRLEGDSLLEVARFVHGFKPAGPHLSVVFTATGAAQTVALAIDRAAWPEVVGTMAGDDTIFVATAGAQDQKRFFQRLERYLEER